jgi:hypothetical protein
VAVPAGRVHEMLLPDDAEQSSGESAVTVLAVRPAGIVSVIVASAVVGPLVTVTVRVHVNVSLTSARPSVSFFLAIPTLGTTTGQVTVTVSLSDPGVLVPPPPVTEPVFS